MDRTSAGLTDVKAETLEQAAALLMLRRDTFRIIDGAGPDVPECTFHGEVPIDFEQFLESGVSLVECPDCTSTSALAPHKRRKTRSTSTEPRWAKREMIWAVVSK